MSYWKSAREPRHSLIFVLPLLLAYEALAWTLGRTGQAAVRNGADVLLKELFVALGGLYGLRAFAVLLLGTGAFLVIRDIRRSGRPVPRVLGGMVVESVVYALTLGVVASAVTSFLLTGRLALVQGEPLQQFSLPVQLMVSLGAGIYEELVFRVLLVAGLAALAHKVLGWKPLPSGIMAALLGALIFSGFHYLGPYGDPWRLDTFTFRAVAGLLFSGLYLTRGFGIAAWTHALYDVFLTVAGNGGR
ncbi:MAG TPA: CPBP family intramembrane glutamic endopeptidase [Gemmatimonadales bacterium]